MSDLVPVLNTAVLIENTETTTNSINCQLTAEITNDYKVLYTSGATTILGNLPRLKPVVAFIENDNFSLKLPAIIDQDASNGLNIFGFDFDKYNLQNGDTIEVSLKISELSQLCDMTDISVDWGSVNETSVQRVCDEVPQTTGTLQNGQTQFNFTANLDNDLQKLVLDYMRKQDKILIGFKAKDLNIYRFFQAKVNGFNISGQVGDNYTGQMTFSHQSWSIDLDSSLFS